MIRSYILRKLSGWLKPVMVARKKGYDQRRLQHVRIGSTTSISGEEQLVLNDHTYIGHFNFIDASNGVFIGEGCQITNYVSILTHSSHHAIRLYGREYVNIPAAEKVAYNRANVIIGAYTFIGPHVVIMPGSRIGKGCIVSAFSYVDGDYPDFSIIAGQPAQVIKSTKDTDEQLLRQHPELEKYYREWITNQEKT